MAVDSDRWQQARWAIFFLLIVSANCTTTTSVLGKVCLADETCSPPYIVCKESVCKHKDLFPMTGAEIAGLFIMTFLIMISITVSVAGGTVIVPISMFLLGFSAKQAVALSNAITFITSLVKYLMSLMNKLPGVPFKTIVDYNTAITLIPPQVLFSTIGGIIGSMFPDLLISILMICVLIWGGVFGIINLKKMIQLERAQKAGGPPMAASTITVPGTAIVVPARHPQELQDRPRLSITKGSMEVVYPEDTDRPLVNGQIAPKSLVVKDGVQNPADGKEDKPILPSINSVAPATKQSDFVLPENNPEIERQKLIESNPFYIKKFGAILIMIILAVLVALFRGGKGFASVIGVYRCSDIDWVIFAIYLALMTAIPFYAKRVIFKEQEHKKAIGWNLGPKEMVYQHGGFYYLLILSAIVGFISTVIGIGGGIIFTPMLLRFGFSPIVSSWTVNLVIFMSKVAAVVVNYMSNDILFSYVWLFGGIISVGTVVSENTLLVAVKKFKSQLFYPIAFMTIVVITLSFCIFVAVNKAKTDTDKG